MAKKLNAPSEVRITCEGALTVPLSSLKDLQGDLKLLSQENYEKLRGLIILHGFSAPFNVWRFADAFYILDGHQRFRTLKRLQYEGCKIPKLPVNLVEAKNVQEAMQKLLGMASQFGSFSKQGTEDFIAKAKMDKNTAKTRFALPRLSIAEPKPPTTPTVPEPQEYLVIVTCRDPEEQFSAYQRLHGEGFNVKQVIK